MCWICSRNCLLRCDCRGCLLPHVTTTLVKQRRPFSRLERAFVWLHGLVAGSVGIIGFFDVDPDWAGLQRIVIVMMVGLWGAGIVATAVVARFVDNHWGRGAILLVGPFAGLVVAFGPTMFGWS